MKVLRVGAEYYIDVDDISILQPWKSRAAKREKSRAEAAECYYDATGGRPILTLITMKDGKVIASPFQPKTLVERAVIRAVVKPSSRRSSLPLDDLGRVILEGERILQPSREMPALPQGNEEEDSEKEPSEEPAPRRLFPFGRR